MRVLSLGAGVQSTAVLLMSLAGELEPLDAAIFADTGWEPREVYAHLDRLEAHAQAAGVPVYRVSGGNIRHVVAMGQGGGLDVPFYLSNASGREGMLRRQCTSKLKVGPIRKKLRALMAEQGVKVADQVFGISFDEVQRMRDPDVRYVRHVYPLVDRGLRRADCIAYLERAGWTAPRSACIGCPYHSDAEWRRLRDESPSEFADAAAWEAEAQAHGLHGSGVPFVHRSRVPLLQVDLSSAEDRGQLTFNDECEGLCGV